jgi:hypothetical protein
LNDRKLSFKPVRGLQPVDRLFTPRPAAVEDVGVYHRRLDASDLKDATILSTHAYAIAALQAALSDYPGTQGDALGF